MLRPTLVTKPVSVSKAFLREAMELLAIRSVIDQPQQQYKALEYIADIIRLHPGIKIERFEQNGSPSLLAYYGTKRPERFKVLLNGHVDVVAGDRTQFEPFIANERLYGRGSLDMKVAALILTHAFCEAAGRVPYALGLQIATDEEPGGYDGAKYQLSLIHI